MCGRSGDSKCEAGFSQFELIVVMIGCVLVLTMAVPVFNSVMDQYRLTMAAQTIQTQIQYARMKAVSSNEDLRVNFPAGERYFQVETGAGARIAGPFYLPRDVAWNSTDPGSDVSFPGRYVTFLPTGNLPAMGNGSEGRVRIINQSGVRIDVVVTRGGQVRQTPAYKTAQAPF